jgi:hypothetical protein
VAKGGDVAQVLPGLAGDDFLPMPSADAGRAWAGLSARAGEPATAWTVDDADGFLPIGPFASSAAPVADAGLDLDALFEASPADRALEQAMASLTPNPAHEADFGIDLAWRQAPHHDDVL